MYKIQTLNKIAPAGLDAFPRERYEIASEFQHPDAILVRSFKMHEMELPSTLKAIARAGTGVNNIPLEKCSTTGIVVFNTPGANANGVKELVLGGLIISSRNICDAVAWARQLKGNGEEVPKLVEKNKSRFAGSEVKGKKLGIVGLGAIGVMVANAAIALGMEVTGYDPFISVEAAWGLSRAVKRAPGLEALLGESDYVTIHVPLTEKTRGMLNKERFAIMKKGVRLMNFARGGLVNNRDLAEAIDAGIVEGYVTDFPDETLLGMDKVTAIPHLGASTRESEENCAAMAAEQVRDFLENGNVTNAVNYPDCQLPPRPTPRIVAATENVPNMLGQVTSVLARHKVNIEEMLNKSKGAFAYNIIDIDRPVDDTIMEEIRAIPHVIMARMLEGC